MRNEKKNQWIKKRHFIVRNAAYKVIAPYTRWKYGVVADKFEAQGERAYLILYNHQTPFDQFFVGMSFRNPIYYLATEDIFSKGWISSLLRWAIAPIPIKKQTMDIKAVKNCIRVAREGGTIAIAPEGNRTYSGRTGHMKPSIAALAKKLKLPIALYRIEGGYGVQPRWSDGIRKGALHTYVSQVIEPEEYESMTNEELFAKIEAGLHVDERVQVGSYRSGKRAEYLERAIYVCPHCGLSEFYSSGNVVECKKCHCKVEYGQDMKLRGMNGEFPFAYVADWYDHQCQFIHGLDLMAYTEKPLYTDRANLSKVLLYKRKVPLRKDACLNLYGDRVVIDEGTDRALSLPFSEVTAAAVLGRNKLNLYHGDTVYQIKGGKRFNALKYVNFYYRYENIRGGNSDGKFLGL